MSKCFSLDWRGYVERSSLMVMSLYAPLNGVWDMKVVGGCKRRIFMSILERVVIFGFITV